MSRIKKICPCFTRRPVEEDLGSGPYVGVVEKNAIKEIPVSMLSPKKISKQDTSSRDENSKREQVSSVLSRYLESGDKESEKSVASAPPSPSIKASADRKLKMLYCRCDANRTDSPTSLVKSGEKIVPPDNVHKETNLRRNMVEDSSGEPSKNKVQIKSSTGEKNKNHNVKWQIIIEHRKGKS